MQIRFRLEMEFWMRQLIVTEQKNIQPDIVVYNISETIVGNEKKKTSIQSSKKTNHYALGRIYQSFLHFLNQNA